MKLPLPTLLAALLLTPLAACGSTDPGTDGDRLSVVASFYPLAYVAERVAGDRADVTNLTTPGQEPHDLELSLERIAQVSDADLVVYEKDLQPAVDDAVASSGPDRQVEAGQVAGLEDGDPHFWLDPERLGAVASAVAAELTDLDPDHADEYSAHLDDLLTDLRALDREFRTGLADCAIDTVVVSHDAFSYLGKYGLSFAAINGLSPDAEPSPAHLVALQRLIDSEGITTVFSESLASPELARSLAGELGIRTAELDPIEGLSDATANEDYLSLMRKNLVALQKASQCT